MQQETDLGKELSINRIRVVQVKIIVESQFNFRLSMFTVERVLEHISYEHLWTYSFQSA